jgi:NTE family protein
LAGKSISLILGSGGARGLAHIGVIQWLVENGYEIRSIAGSSMGALIGGIYAAGKLDVYAEWVTRLQRMDVLRLLDPTLHQAGLIKGDRIIGVLRELIGDCAIEDLPISFTAVATDLDTGKEVWLRKGSLFDALRASISTPLVFTPWQFEGRTLLDGALVNPIPIAPTLNDTTDLTIAVSLSGADLDQPLPPEAEPAANGNGYRQRIAAFFRRSTPEAETEPKLGLIDVAFAAMDTMQNTIARLKLAAYSPDVIVEIPRNACHYHEFWRGRELIRLGRERAAAALARPLP